MVNRIADILQAEGDPDPVDVRRSKAIGILAQPADALRLLLDHQSVPPHPADPPESLDDSETADVAERAGLGQSVERLGLPAGADAPDPDADPDGDGDAAGRYRSVRLSPLPVDPDRCRPPATIYVHLAAETLAAGRGIARVEDPGPVLLTRVRRLLGDRCRGCQIVCVSNPEGRVST
jgi:hypothetical protein